MAANLVNTEFVELAQNGQIASLVAGQIEIGSAEDEGLIALVAAILDEGRRFGVGAGNDDARHAHDVELEPGSIEALDLFVYGDEHFAALVAALLGSRLLVFDVIARNADLDETANQIADMRVSTMAGVGVGDDERPEVDGWR